MIARPALSPAEIARGGAKARRCARHYTATAQTFIANLAAHPDVAAGRFADVHLVLMLSDLRTDNDRRKPMLSIEETIAELFDRRAVPAASAIGREVVLGMRVMEGRCRDPSDYSGTKPASWDDAWQWADSALRLRAVCEAMRRVYGCTRGQRILIEVEDYMGSMPPPDPAVMAARLAPFIEVIQEYGVVPCLSPFEIEGKNGSCAIVPILDAIDGQGEIWTYDGYGLADLLRLGRDTAPTLAGIARREYLARRRWPGIHVHHGYQSRLLREWTTDEQWSLLEETLGIGWFDESADRADNMHMGKPEWFRGETAHPNKKLNEAAFRFNYPANTRSLPKEERGRIALTPATLPVPVPRSRVDVVSTRGYLLAGGISAWARTLPAAPPYAIVVACEIQPTTPDGPIIGTSQPNQQLWQLVHREGRIVLQVRRTAPEAGTFWSEHDLGPVKHAVAHTGPAMRIGLAFASSTVIRWAISVPGLVTSGEIVLPSPMLAPKNPPPVWRGAGCDVSSDGAKTQAFGDGLVLVTDESWHEDLTLAELVIVTSKSFPRFS